MHKNKTNSCFRTLGTPAQTWAIPAIHGDLDKLISLHDAVFEHIKPGDRLIYLGNYTGYDLRSAETIDEILTFRRILLAQPGMIPTDIVYLRGQQEEMWQKLLQLSFAPDPMSVLLWMLGNGLSATLESYGISVHDGIEACSRGISYITKWTGSIREAVRKHPGHETLATHQVRAAHSCESASYPMLFVHAGINSAVPLENQGDNFWWATAEFEEIKHPYAPFEKVIRGYDPHHRGLHLNCVTATIDAGCGFGGSLICAGFGQNGEVLDIIEA